MTINPIRKCLHKQIFEYDRSIYPFKELIEDFFGCELGNLHAFLGSYPVFHRSNDQSTLAHKVFYANYNKLLMPLYVQFLREFIRPIVGVPFYYQQIPTFRVGLPGNKFVGEFHKDSAYNHQPYEVNFNLGLANYTGSAALRLMDDEKSDQSELLECDYGQVFSFDHIDCLHGSDPNPYNQTMVSFDFRLAIVDLYYESDSCSVNMKTKFLPGYYFSNEPI